MTGPAASAGTAVVRLAALRVRYADVHIDVASKARWYAIRDALPQRREQESFCFSPGGRRDDGRRVVLLCRALSP